MKYSFGSGILHIHMGRAHPRLFKTKIKAVSE